LQQPFPEPVVQQAWKAGQMQSMMQEQVQEQVQEQEPALLVLSMQFPHSAPYQVNTRRQSPPVRTLPLQVVRSIPDPLSSTVKKNSHIHEVI
jgi:hypothetical protein